MMKSFRQTVLLAGLAGQLCSTPEDSGTSRERRTGAGEDSPSGGSPGYVLFSPLLSTTTYLIDKEATVVHTWESDFPPGASEYLLDNGHLLRCARQPGVVFRGAGQGGRIQELDWEGDLVWDFVFASEDRLQHHDIEPLPNGNVLLITWERKTPAEAIQAGRDPNRLSASGLWPDGFFEIEPEHPNRGRIVWEWHLWDHLVQDLDPSCANYGSVSEHPELIDINGDGKTTGITDALLHRLKALGYMATDAAAPDVRADFMHTNSIAYHPGLDQVALSVNHYNEIWILDHSTTTQEAAGHTGGRAGKGGDLLYRWGNPRTYGRGTLEHQEFFGQHDARWIPEGYPGAGNLLVFNNGPDRPSGRASSVVEIQPPLEASTGRYLLSEGGRYGPDKPTWRYSVPQRFFADFISGAHRLAKGSTFICSGPSGWFFEVSPKGDIVWEYRNPYSGDAPNPAGDPPYSVFRATHIAPEHPALAGRRLTALDPQPPRSR